MLPRKARDKFKHRENSFYCTHTVYAESDEVRHMIYFRINRADRPEPLACNPDALCDPFYEFDGVHVNVNVVGERQAAAASASKL